MDNRDKVNVERWLVTTSVDVEGKTSKTFKSYDNAVEYYQYLKDTLGGPLKFGSGTMISSGDNRVKITLSQLYKEDDFIV